MFLTKSISKCSQHDMLLPKLLSGELRVPAVSEKMSAAN
jgi:hypothetical protein